MVKKTRKEIEQTLRNKIANKYNEEREYQQKRYADLWDAYCRARKECDKYQQENEELKEKIRQYEDWIHRLQEFVDMPEDMRKAEIKKMQDDQKFSEYIADRSLFKMLGLCTGDEFSIF